VNEIEIAAGLPPAPQYRYAQRVGDQLFVAGQVPLDAGGRLVGRDDPRAQALQCLNNLKLLLGAHGFAVTDVRRLVVHVVGDAAALKSAWAAVSEWFSGDVPPATLLGAARLGHADQSVEIDATVVKHDPPREIA
jgi:enamine deaminase RidA (YjgF/YER057c/UK114 family)